VALLRGRMSGLRSLFRKEQITEELDEEVQGFLEMAAEEKMEQGMSRKNPLRVVRLEHGNLEATKEVVRSAGWEYFVETSWQDFALRGPHAPEEFRFHRRRSAAVAICGGSQS
jgi:hypothetical protein